MQSSSSRCRCRKPTHQVVNTFARGAHEQYFRAGWKGTHKTSRSGQCLLVEGIRTPGSFRVAIIYNTLAAFKIAARAIWSNNTHAGADEIKALPVLKESLDVSFAVENGDDLQSLRLRSVDNLIRTHRPKQNRSAGQIFATVSLAWRRSALGDVFINIDEISGGPRREAENVIRVGAGVPLRGHAASQRTLLRRHLHRS